MGRFIGHRRIISSRKGFVLVTLVLIAVSIKKYSFPNASLDSFASYNSVEGKNFVAARNTSLYGTTTGTTTTSARIVTDASSNLTDTTSWAGNNGSNLSLPWTEAVWAQVQAQNGSTTFDPSISIDVGQDVMAHVHNGRLVANVDESYLFWDDGSIKLCNLLRNITLSSSIDDATHLVPPALVNVTMDCVDYVVNREGFGQGNWVTAIYSARMAAAVAGVDFQFRCKTGREHELTLLLPWFDRYQAAPPNRSSVSWPYTGPRPTEQEACPATYRSLRIDHMAVQIQDDMRKMAVTLVGSSSPDDETRRHPDIPVDAMPLIPGVVLDDVALHFRCGDVLGGARRNDFGMIRFNEYKKWIPQNTPSIGILTQPFEKEQNRGKDRRKAHSCRKVVTALVDYLQSFVAPQARISIHNGINETLPLTYARLVMANISITSLSSFGIFPVIGTFGQGYFQRGNRGVNPFATHIPKYLDNVHEMDADVRGTGTMFGKPVEELIEWFIDDPNNKEEVLPAVVATNDAPAVAEEMNPVAAAAAGTTPDVEEVKPPDNPTDAPQPEGTTQPDSANATEATQPEGTSQNGSETTLG